MLVHSIIQQIFTKHLIGARHSFRAVDTAMNETALILVHIELTVT